VEGRVGRAGRYSPRNHFAPEYPFDCSSAGQLDLSPFGHDK